MLYQEVKKNPRVDLSRIRPVIFSGSLAIALLLAIFAFEWKSYDKPEEALEQKRKNDFEQILDVPPTEIAPPPPASMRSANIVEVADEEKIKKDVKLELDIEITSETVLPNYVYTAPVQEPPKLEEEESEKIFVVVEQTAAPKDGMAAFYKYVSENIKYPAQALRMGIEGRVFVQFVVDKDGSLSQFEVIKGIGCGCDEEAIRIIQNSPPWQSGRQRGKPVRQRMVLPIHFQLMRR